MDISSLIDNIKFSIASTAKGKVHVRENSFLFDLLKEDAATPDSLEKEVPAPGGRPFRVSKPWQGFSDHRFPFMRFLLRLPLFCFECVVWLFYQAMQLLRALLTGKSLHQDISTSPRLNFVVLATGFVVCIVAVFTTFVFFLKSVLLYKPYSGSNDQGAIAINQPCGVEQYMFLFNTAECWANTGIKVLEGDEYVVTASGTFYSKIYDMDRCARQNRHPAYTRTRLSPATPNSARDGSATLPPPSPSPTKSLWMYHADVARFGSLLLQVREEHEPPCYYSDRREQGDILQLPTDDDGRPRRLQADRAGVLFFSVNDIYLSPAVTDALRTAPDSVLDALHLERNAVDTLVERAKERPELWFDDNVGEILLNVTVYRNQLPSSFVPDCVVKAYRRIELASKDFTLASLLPLLLALLLLLFLDYLAGRHIKKVRKAPL